MRRTIRTVVLIAVVSVAVLGVETGRADEGVTTTVGNRFSQTSTPLTNEQGTFEAVFTHRFNQAVKDAGGSTLWGLDRGPVRRWRLRRRRHGPEHEDRLQPDPRMGPLPGEIVARVVVRTGH
jgi:hypothetical protein